MTKAFFLLLLREFSEAHKHMRNDHPKQFLPAPNATHSFLCLLNDWNFYASLPFDRIFGSSAWEDWWVVLLLFIRPQDGRPFVINDGISREELRNGNPKKNLLLTMFVRSKNNFYRKHLAPKMHAFDSW